MRPAAPNVAQKASLAQKIGIGKSPTRVDRTQGSSAIRSAATAVPPSTATV